MTVADVQLCENIKKEIEDRYSPASSSVSLSSNISVAPQSGPSGSAYSQQQQQIHQRQQQQHHHQHHQQQQQQLTARMFLTSQANSIASASGEMADMTATTTGNSYLLPCPLCDIPLEPRVFRQHLDRHYPRDSPVCPVLECGRRFAHPNSVRNHMRLKHPLQWAKMKAMRSSGGPFTGLPDFK